MKTPIIKCLIIQLARFGDTLQSLMALRAAKELYPSLEIHFLVREKFAAAAQRIPWIQSVITLPTEALLGPLLRSEKKEEQALRDLARWIAPLVKSSWDMTVNWSYSEASSYLTALMPSRIKLGYTRRRGSSFAGADGWSHYIQAIVQGEIKQNIHLTDISTTQLLTALQIHAGDPKSDGNTPATSKEFFNLSLETPHSTLESASKSKTQKWLGIQLGTGKNLFGWEARNWAQLIRYLHKRHPDYGIYLFGREENKKTEQEILKELSDLDPKPNTLVSLVGKTSFDQWASLVGHCQWLLAGDTAAIHLASVLGTRVFNISLNSIKHAETGPYGNGHYVISSENGTISPEATYAAWTYANNEWNHRRQLSLTTHFAQLGWSEHLHSVRLSRSRIRNSQEGGGVTFDPLTKKALCLDDWMCQVLGHMARSWYCGWTPPTGQELTREMIHPGLIKELRVLREASGILSKICVQSELTATELHTRSSALKSKNLMSIQERESIQQLAKKLADLEVLLEKLAASHPSLQAFSRMSKVQMHHLQGKNVSDLGRETAVSYKQLNDGAFVLKQWIDFSLNLVKPRVVSLPNISPLKELSP